MALRELLASFDIKVDDAPIKKGEKAVAGFVDRLKAAGKVVAAGLGVQAFAGFIEGQIQAGSVVNDLSEKLGISTQALQAFQFAAGQNGVSAEGTAAAVSKLNKVIGEARLGTESAQKTFNTLGIKFEEADGKARPLQDVVLDVADKMREAGDAAKQTAIATDLFGKSGAELIPLLKGGRKALAENLQMFQALGGGLQEDFVQAADKAGDEVDKLKLVFTGMKSQIALQFLPTITNLTTKFTRFSAGVLKLSRETNILKIGFAGVAGFAAFKLGKQIFEVGKAFGLAEKFAGGFGKGLKAAFSLGFQGLAIVAAITAIVLIVEDLYNLFTGEGSSAIGEWLDEFLGVGTAASLVFDLKEAFDEVLAAIRPLMPELSGLFEYLAPVLKVIGKLLLFTFVTSVRLSVDTFKTLANVLREIFAGVSGSISVLLEGVSKLAGFVGADKLKGALAGASAKTNAFALRQDAAADFQGLGQSLTRNANAISNNAQTLFAGAAGKPTREPVGFTRGDFKLEQANTFQTVINGATNPEATGQAVKRAQGDSLGKANQQAKAALAVGG